MTGRFNSPRITNHDRMPRQDVEDIKGNTALVGPAPKARPKLSKAGLREQAAAAFLAWREGRKTKDR
jgi:hypothetical protein